MDLSILIVTYNSAALIGDLLDRLHAELTAEAAHLKAEVVVVDNASRDDTVERVRRGHPWVQLQASPVNLGFAAGNNLAARHARGRWLLLLNPDAMPARGALRAAVTRLRATPGLGLLGGLLLSPEGRPQPSGRMFPTLRDEIFTLAGLAARFPRSRLFARLDRRWADPLQEAAVDWIPGAFVFIPADVFRQLGGFDERFFMYYEEVDLCRRLHAAGLAVFYWPELRATHIGGASARTVSRQRVSRAGGQLEGWRMRSALLYYRKHHGLGGALGWQTIEWGWNKLRGLRSAWRGQTVMAADLRAHCAQLVQAWRDTQGGLRSPARPW